MADDLGLTWWGHSSTTVELDGVRIGTDPLLTGRLAHLRRAMPAPPQRAASTDLVLISHLHSDHLHIPSLRRFAADVPILAPPGTRDLAGDLAGGRIYEVRPGETVEIAGVHVQVLPSYHDGRRHPLSRSHSPALGFRITSPRHSFWYPGDTGLTSSMHEVDPVDLALVPIGGWGPSLGEQHLDPAQAAEALRRVGARFAVPVHYGTYWPIGFRRLRPDIYRRLFVSPPRRFVAEVEHQHVRTSVRVPRHGEHVSFDDGDGR